MIVFEAGEENKGSLLVTINRSPATDAQLEIVAKMLNFDVRLKESIDKVLEQVAKEAK